MTKTCAITGHRPAGFSWDYNNKQSPQHIAYLANIQQLIIHLVQMENYTTFITGGAMGVDTDFATAVLQLQDTLLPHIRLELALPYIGHINSIPKSNRQNYMSIVQRANKVSYICQQYSKICFVLRNRYMVDNAQLLLAFYNGIGKGGTHQTIQYATKKHVPIITNQL